MEARQWYSPEEEGKPIMPRISAQFNPLKKRMDTKRTEAVANVVRELLERMTVPAEVTVQEPILPLQGEFVCHIRIAEGSNLLIGQRGLNLEALQTLARLIVRKSEDGWANFSVDVNNYQTEKTKAIFAEAKEAETKVARDKAAIFLRPMTAFERKCIHLTLADSELVTTESAGTGENRKVIVKPKGDL